MATLRYFNPSASGANDGTSESDAWESFADMATGLGGITTDQVIVYWKRQANAWNPGASVTWSVNVPTGGAYYHVGYTSTPGDNGIFEMAFTSSGHTFTISGDGNTFANIRWSNNATTSGDFVSQTADHAVFINCGFEVTTLTTGNLDTFANGTSSNRGHTTMVGCWAYNTSTHTTAAALNVHNIHARHCVIRSNARGIRARASSRPMVIMGCDIAPYAASPSDMFRGVDLDDTNNRHYQAIVTGCRIARATTMVRIETEPDLTRDDGISIYGNVFYDGTNGVEWPSGASQYNGLFLLNNAFGALSKNVANYTDMPVLDWLDVALSGDPFMDSGSGDLRIDPTSAGGRQLIDAGLGALPTYDASIMPPVNLADVASPVLRRPVLIS